MECKKCGKTINEFETYCDDCKLLLNKEKELDKLIDENKELNKLEITKEVETLQSFKDEKKESESSLKEDLKDLVNIGELEMNLDEKDNKVPLFIIGIIVGLLIIILLVFLFWRGLFVIYKLLLWMQKVEVQQKSSCMTDFCKFQ